MKASWIVVGLLGCVSAMAAERPAFQNLRYEENASAYRDVKPASAADRIKFIPLNDEGTAFLSLGGQAQLRWELWENFGFDPANDDDVGLFRLRLHADAHAGEHLRVFVEGKSATATGRDLPGGRRTLDVDEADLQNAFVDVSAPLGDAKGTARLGRQELSYGAQRLVSPLDWTNARRTFDGGRLLFRADAWRADLFATRPVIVEKYDFNEPDDDTGFHGLYATGDFKDWKLKADLYSLYLQRDLPEGKDEDRCTTGARLDGTCPLTGIAYDVEGAGQFGETADQDIEAWFAAAKASYTFADVPTKPLLYLGYDHASGDCDPDDDTAATFDQLYPLSHAFLGYADVLGRRNVVAFSQGLSCWPVEKTVQVSVDYHYFRRAEAEDAVYNAGGGVFRKADAALSREIGSEVDLTLLWKMCPNMTASTGYSRFFAGDFIERSGPSSDLDFVYGSMQFTF